MTDERVLLLLAERVVSGGLHEHMQSIMDRIQDVVNAVTLTTLLANKCTGEEEIFTSDIDEGLKMWLKDNFKLGVMDEPEFWCRLVFFIRDHLQDGLKKERKDNG